MSERWREKHRVNWCRLQAFEGCTFQHLGAFGASAGNGSQGVAWRRCRFRDISGGAVWLGGTDTWNCNGGDASVTTPTPCTAADPATVDRNYTIEDCGIQQAELYQEFPWTWAQLCLDFVDKVS